MIKLKPYQKEARQFAIDNDGRALFFEDATVTDTGDGLIHITGMTTQPY